MIRSLLQVVSRRVVLKRRLPPRLGGDTIFVSPESALSYWRRDLDATSKELFDFAERFVGPGDVVWDVGANLGLFTFASAFRAGPSGRVVAIEPDTFFVDLLRKSAARGTTDRARVDVLPAAVSGSFGVSEFRIAKGGGSMNHLASGRGGSQSGGSRGAVSVVTVTLDSLAEFLPAPSTIKIDVEGAEHLALAGARHLLSEAKPVVICEVAGENSDECSKILKGLGYHLYDLDDLTAGEVERAAWNTLAVADDRRFEWGRPSSAAGDARPAVS